MIIWYFPYFFLSLLRFHDFHQIWHLWKDDSKLSMTKSTSISTKLVLSQGIIFFNAYGLCNFIATEMKSASDIETTLTYPSLILSFQNVLFSKVKIPTNEIKRGRYKKLFFCIMYGCVISRWRQACIKWHTTEQVYRISKGNEHRRATK